MNTYHEDEDDIKAFADINGCGRKVIGFIIVILATLLLLWLTSCAPYKSTTKPKNGHPKLYQKPKHS